MGLVACHWSRGENKQCEELYPIIIDLQEKRLDRGDETGGKGCPGVCISHHWLSL